MRRDAPAGEGDGDERARGAEFQGRSVEEAVASGLADLGVERAEVAIDVLDKGRRGLLGLIGARPARVRLVLSGSPAETVRLLAEDLLGRMGFPGKIKARMSGRTVELRVEASGDTSLLIGRKGETLHALQHVLLRMASQRVDGGLAQVRVDIAGYQDRQEANLERLAADLAERVVRTGKRAMTDPLPAAERRRIHRVLAEDARVESHALGTGDQKRIVVTPSRRREKS